MSELDIIEVTNTDHDPTTVFEQNITNSMKDTAEACFSWIYIRYLQVVKDHSFM